MKARPLWACSAIAFQVSLRERVPSIVQGASLRLGVASFWAALALEGRALDAWRDLRSLGSDACGIGSRTSANMLEDLKDLLVRCDESCPDAPAWSLPNTDRMRALGLGCVWAVLCPFCEDFHAHSPGEDVRTPHCGVQGRDGGRYLLQFCGALPTEHHDRFCRSAKAGLPRFLRSGPEAADPDLPSPQPLAA